MVAPRSAPHDTSDRSTALLKPVPRWAGSVHSAETPTQSPWKAPRPRASTAPCSSLTVAKVVSPDSRTARALSPYFAARSSVASQASSSDRVVSGLGDLVRTELPDHLGHRGEQQQGRVVGGPSGLREGVRLRPVRVDVRAGRQGAGGVPPGHLRPAPRTRASPGPRARAPSCPARRNRPRRGAPTRRAARSRPAASRAAPAGRPARRRVDGAARVWEAPASRRRCRRWRSPRRCRPRGAR